MQSDERYQTFERTAINAYDLAKLDKEFLAVLMEPLRGADVDSGGSAELKSKDGKGLERIIVETWGIDVPVPPTTPVEEDEEAWEAYEDAIYTQMGQVTLHFGWNWG